AYSARRMDFAPGRADRASRRNRQCRRKDPRLAVSSDLCHCSGADPVSCPSSTRPADAWPGSAAGESHGPVLDREAPDRGRQLAIAAAVGVALYVGRPWPLHVLGHADEIGHMLVVWLKVAAKFAIFVGAGVAVLWAGIRAVRKRLRPAGHHAGASSTDGSC